MAQGPLHYRTPFIEELPVIQSRQAPGFAWVAVSGPAAEDPAKNWGTNNRKRATRNAGTGGEGNKEASTARHRIEVEKRLRDLNTDGTAQVVIPKAATTVGAGGGATKAGKTSNTKKILASGKTFAHYLDDEEAEIALRGRRDIEGEVSVVKEQRASKTPIARRKPQAPVQEASQTASPAPTTLSASAGSSFSMPMDIDGEGDLDGLEAMPTQAELQALLDAPPLTYNQARSAPPPPSAPPPRKFCEICGYWGRVKCMKCGNMTCSVSCKDTHDEHKCLKFYA